MSAKIYTQEEYKKKMHEEEELIRLETQQQTEIEKQTFKIKKMEPDEITGQIVKSTAQQIVQLSKVIDVQTKAITDATLCLADLINILAFWSVTYGIDITEDFFALSSLEAVG